MDTKVEGLLSHTENWLYHNEGLLSPNNCCEDINVFVERKKN